MKLRHYLSSLKVSGRQAHFLFSWKCMLMCVYAVLCLCVHLSASGPYAHRRIQILQFPNSASASLWCNKVINHLSVSVFLYVFLSFLSPSPSVVSCCSTAVIGRAWVNIINDMCPLSY